MPESDPEFLLQNQLKLLSTTDSQQLGVLGYDAGALDWAVVHLPAERMVDTTHYCRLS